MEGYIKAKPLLNDVYKRNGGVHPDAILNEIRAINDHVARYYDSNRSEEEKAEELTKADGHLKRMIYDAYKQLNIFFFDYMNKFEEENFGAHWLHADKGAVWLQYIENRGRIVEFVRQAKLNESISSEEAMKCFEKAYTVQRHTYKLMDDNHHLLVLSGLNKRMAILNSQKGWLLSTICLAFIPALLYEIIKHWGAIVGFISTNAATLFHSFCKWGLTL